MIWKTTFSLLIAKASLLFKKKSYTQPLLLIFAAFFFSITNGNAQFIPDGNYSASEYADAVVKNINPNAAGTCDVKQVYSVVKSDLNGPFLLLGLYNGNAGNSIFRYYLDTDPTLDMVSETYKGTVYPFPGADVVVQVNANDSAPLVYKWNETTSSLELNNSSGVIAKAGDYNTNDGQFIEIKVPLSGGDSVINICDLAEGGVINLGSYLSFKGGSLNAEPCGQGNINLDINVTGTISGSTSYCSGSPNSTLLTLTGNYGAVETWQKQEEGLGWVDIPNTANQNTYTANNVTVTTNYRAIIVNNTCPDNEVETGTATITINPSPDAPSSSGDITQCEMSPIQTLDANNALASSTGITWYDAATGGNSVSNPILKSIGSVTYYAEYSNGTCSSPDRTPVTLEIQAAPEAPASGGDQTVCEQDPIQTLTATATVPNGFSVVWYETAEGGNPVSPTLSSVGSKTYYAEAVSNSTNCISNTRTPVTLEIQAGPEVPVSGGDQTVCEQDPIQTLTATATVPDGYTVFWFDAPTGGSPVTPTLSSVGSKTYYAEASNDDTECTSLTRTPVTLEIQAAPQAPASGGDQTVCEQDPIQTLTATATVPNGFSVVWYDTAEGGNVVSPTLSSVGSKTYYAEAVNSSTNCTSTTRTPVTLEIQAAPEAPVSGGDQTVCEQDPIQTLTATATVPNGFSVVWYDTAEGGNPVSPTLSSVGSKTYYAEASNDDTECTSLTRTPVTLEIQAAPVAPTSGGDQTVCEQDPIQTLTATATVPNGFSVVWYETAEGGNPVSPTLSSVGSKTYYAEASNDDTECTSLTRTPVTLEIQAAPIAPTTGGDQTVCEQDPIQTLTATATVPNGFSVVWYETAEGGNPVSPTLSSVGSKTYYAEAVSNSTNCISNTRTPVTLEIQAGPEVPVSGGDQTVCEQDPIQTLTATATVPDGYTIFWFDAPTGGSPVTPTLSSVGSKTYYAEASNDDTECTSLTRTPVTLEIQAAPIAPTTGGDQTVCEQDPIQTLTATATVPNGFSVVWYDTAEGGNVVSPTLSSVGSKTYFAEAVNSSTNCTSNTRTPVTLEIQAAPDAPVSGGDQSVCFLEGQSLTATATTPNGYSVVWYDAAEDGNIVNPTLNTVGSVTYYAEAVNSTSDCTSNSRTAVTLEILPEVSLTAEANTVTCNGEEDGMITYTSNGTVTIFDSSNSDVTSENGSLPAGIYTVIANETGGNSDASCSKELKIEIKVRDNESPAISVPASLDIETCEASGITAENARFPLNTGGSENIIDSFTADGYTASDDQTVESITYTDVVDDSGCMPVVTRTFYAKDNCGAESSASITINLTDNTKPVFNETLPEEEITVECSDIPTAEILTATDACIGDVNVSFEETKEDTNGDKCGNTFTITRTWSAEDCSGNILSFTQTINVVDTTAPVFDQELPEANIEASCDDVPAAMELTATDACEGFVNVVFNETKQDDDECATNYTLVRTWTAIDCAGNEASFTQNVIVSDNEKPEFVEELPADITVECDNVPSAASLTATDNCTSEVNVNFTEETSGENDDCTNVYTITRTWTAADCAGNEVSHIQVINVIDTTAPEFNETIPADMSMECENLPDAPTITATDNCDSEVMVEFSETSDKEGEDDKEYVVTRTWSVTDCAGNTTSQSQKITIANTGAPSFNENLPGDITVECDSVPEAAVLTASDNCVGEANVNFEELITGQDDDCANEYTITRTWTASDDANNETVHVQTINVIDTTAPEFDQEMPEAKITAECNAVPEAMTFTATDNCSESVTVNYTEEFAGLDDDCASTYTITRTWSVSDCAGNENSFTQMIEVIDTTAPTFNEELPSENMTVECDAVPAAMTLTASDNCAETASVNFNEEISDKDSEADNNYTITRTWVATDCAGNDTSFVQVVNVEDTTAPVITSCPEPVQVSADAGVCSASEDELGMPVATDNCNAEVNMTNDAPEVFPVGETTVTWTITDNAGNASTCTQVVTVVDDQAPVVETMNNITVNSDAGVCGAVVEFGMIGATDNCELASVEVTEGFTSGSEFPVGTTTVTWTVTDTSGNTTTSSFDVTVVDNENPEITCPENMTVSTTEGMDYAIVEFADATATDNCEVTVEQTAGPVSGSQFPIGTTTVTFTATDAAGNTTDCSFTVTVEDEEDPTLECPSNMTQSVDAGVCGAVVEFETPSGVDNSGDVSVTQTAGPLSGEVFPVGTTTVTFTATDAAGNTATCSFTVTVNDDEGPQIDDMNDITVNTDAGICGAVVNFVAPGATDNCGVESVVLTDGLDSGSEFPVGETTVTYTATDTAGNTATTSFTVTVLDNEAPVITCPENIELTVAIGTTSVVVEYAAITTTDNCDGTTVELTAGIASGEEFPLGTTTVSYTVTDASGNSTSCSFTVTVEEEALPDPPSTPTGTVTTVATCAEPNGTITVNTIEGLTYSIDGENYQESGIFADLAPGTYEVTARDQFGQTSTAAVITIEDPVADTIQVASDPDLCIEDSVYDLFELLIGDVDESGTWIDTDNTGALDNGFIDPSLMELGTYTFTYQLDGNCPSSTDVTVSINDDCVVLACTVEDLKEGISKVVTPNGDNRNDFFEVDLDTQCGFTYDLMIFNRWGNKIFEAQNYQNNWDGYSRSSFTSSDQLPAGTYYYVLTVRNSDFEPIQGYIYLGTK